MPPPEDEEIPDDAIDDDSKSLDKRMGPILDMARSFAEIAEVLGIPANTAASRYRLALDTLRRRLHPSMV